jgi:cobalamin-dependent methionine synthase I
VRREAEDFLKAYDGKYQAYALFDIVDAHSDNDDIVIDSTGKRLPMLRQQQAESEFLCLADFLLPHQSSESLHPSSRIGLFATSVDKGMETDFDHDPYLKMMAQLLADRLAEAAAERMHEEVRKHYWGYAPDENLSIHEMQLEHFQGIRPAVGYPSLPDASMNFLLDDLLDMKQIGISLTESGAMRPHASVSGLMISHPKSHYFSIGKIGEDQLADYARRRQMPVETIRKFLSANI